MSSQRPSGGGGLSVKTVVIASCAAMTAALVVPMIWRPGTLIATGLTPVIVLLTQELLKRPVDAVTAVSKKVVPGSPESLASASAEAAPAVTAPRAGQAAPAETAPPEDRFGLQADLRRRDRTPARRRGLRAAVVTGLVGAVIAIVALTTTELTVFGKGLGSKNDGTTFFSGSSSKQKTTTTTTETTTTTTEQKATPDAESTPAETPTPTPTASPSATPTPTPQAAAPQSTATPAPTP